MKRTAKSAWPIIGSAPFNAEFEAIAFGIDASPTPRTTADRLPAKGNHPTIGAAQNARPAFALASIRANGGFRQLRLTIATQTAIAILKGKTATTGIARIALAAQLAGNVAQAATGLIADGACG